MQLALFDLDFTLLEGDCNSLWIEYMIETGLLKAENYRRLHEEFIADYMNNELNMNDFLHFQLQPLTWHKPEVLAEAQAHFAENKINPMLRRKGLEAIEKHRMNGHLPIIITASNEFIASPIARMLEVDTLIATQIELIDGQPTGRGLGIPSFGEGKVERLENWLQDRNTSRSKCTLWFYSDSFNDRPLLDYSDHPIAVNPDSLLAEHARTNGWQVEDWSQSTSYGASD